MLVGSYFEMGGFGEARQQLEAIYKLIELTGKACPGLEEMAAKVGKAQDRLEEPENAADSMLYASETQTVENQDEGTGIRALRGISPYFGFPEKAGIAGRSNNYGFIYSSHRGPVDYPYVPAENEYVVGVFGGSVASGFFQDCAEFLEQKLSEHPDLAGRDVVLLNFAMGASKQPQQLNYLNYFVGIGQHFDVVINIDGINDMVGSLSNYNKGVHPAMPDSALIDALEVLASVSDLNCTNLEYFLRLAAAEEKLRRAEEGGAGPFPRFSGTSKLKKKIEELRNNPPDGMVTHRLIEVPGTGKADYLTADDQQRDKLRTTVLDHWERCAQMMFQTCKWAGIRYVHSIQPNHYYCRKTLGPGDARIMDEGFRVRLQVMVKDTWPGMIKRAQTFDREYPVYCHMTDVLDELTENVFSDAICHFTSAGHQAMAERLCEFLLPQNFEFVEHDRCEN